MQYDFGEFGGEFTPMAGVFAPGTPTYMPSAAFETFPHPGYPVMFGEHTFPSKNHYAPATNISRQSTMANTPMAPQHFVSRLVPLPGRQGSFMFRKRNSAGASRGRRRPSSFMRNGTSFSNRSRGFVPRVYTTDVYPGYIPFARKPQKDEQGRQSPLNDSTNPSGANTPERQESEWVNFESLGTPGRLRPRRSQRNPYFTKVSPLERAYESLKTVECPKLDPKDVFTFLEGLLAAAFNVLKSIVGELRSDVIAGLFLGDDPDYNAARSYYYTNLNQKVPCSGLTQRIDYAEAIEHEYRNRIAEREEQLRPEDVPRYLELGRKDIMHMNEAEFEEYLLREAYPDAPPSVSWNPTVSQVPRL